LLAEEEILGGQARVGPQAKHHQVEDVDHEIEGGADHHWPTIIARK
jgi:hypothetical protein